MGAVREPELYRCAAAINAVSDLGDMYSRYSGLRDGRSAAMTYWERSMGIEDLRSPRETFDRASPAQHAEQVLAAVLLIHGEDDSVVPIWQSRIMERALRDAGKTVQLVELENEDTWLSEGVTRQQTLEALEPFLAQHLGGR